MMSNQIRAEFGTIDQASSDINAYAGNTQGQVDELMSEVSRAISNFAGGMGADQHHAVMTKARQLAEEYVSSQRQHGQATASAGDTLHTGGTKMSSILGQGA
jgi:uncharacterized protein YukE